MREFVYGTNAQYRELDRALSEGKKYMYAERKLPDECMPDTACMWFEKVNDAYRVCIDKGILTGYENTDFRNLLERGEAVFPSMDSMISFFHSLQPLFEEETGREASAVIDKEKLNAIRNESEAVKTVWPEEIAEPLKRKVFGQDSVIDALAELVVIGQMRSDRKLLVVTLLGPTATGKSETAKSLAQVMSEVYGRTYGYIEIAGSEFIGEHTVHRFFGAPPGYVGHGEPTLLEPVRKNPYHVIVINEIEKTDDKILVGLMEAIDTGQMGMADNTKPIDLNKCVLLFTSNIPVDMTKYQALSAFERSEMCRDVFTKHCGRPEISGKIGNFLVFSPLSDDAMTDIIIKFIREELDSYELELAHVDEYLMADFLKQRTKYGARGIRGLVNEAVGRHILRNRNLVGSNGKKISLSGSIENIEFKELEEGA
jgi:ATP-dependent Clp protease ATP-binding subunit ClpA